MAREVRMVQGNSSRIMEREEAGNSHVLDIRALAKAMRNELGTPNSSMQALNEGTLSCLIHKVNDGARNVDPAEYEPCFVSIGPYHRSSTQMSRDVDKRRCLNHVLSVSSTRAFAIEDYLTRMADLEKSARSCYANTFDMSSEEFVRMMLLDGCYLLVHLADLPSASTASGGTMSEQNGGSSTTTQQSANVDSKRPEDVAVVRDIIYLLENQIPFSVIDTIHELLTGQSSVLDKIAEYVRDLVWKRYTRVLTVAPQPRPCHLLHLLHMHFRPTNTREQSLDGTVTDEPVGRWRRATEYYKAGVKFKKRDLNENTVRCILDVKHDGGILEVPCLNIDSETWRILRNLMALEQGMSHGLENYVTAYCIFMSQIACEAEDVALLSRKGIIVHLLGSDQEVADGFADLCKGIVFDVDDADYNYLRSTCHALERRYRSRTSNWIAWLRRKYLSNPWLAIGLAAAFIALVCGVVQAVYAVLSYKNQPESH